ncbi:MAG: PEGA domain-containing protein, partial [Bacillota bacterium]
NKLIINSMPEGASVFIDEIYFGKTPFETKDIKGKSLKVKVTLNEYTREQTVSQLTGTNEVFFVMDGDYGLLNVSTFSEKIEFSKKINFSEKADVFIDDTLRGETPLKNIKLPTGVHKMTVKSGTYDVIEKTIAIRPVKYDYRLKLEKTISYVSLKDSTRIKGFNIEGIAAQRARADEYKITKGERTLEVFAVDYERPISGKFNIEENLHYELTANYNYFTPKYILMSAGIPGLGQIADGSGIKGAAYLAGVLVSAGLYYKAVQDHDEQEPEFEKNRQEYFLAINEETAMKYRELLENSVSKMNETAGRKKLFLGAAIGIYIINIIDAVIFHSKGSDLQLNKKVGLNFEDNRLGIKIEIN